MASASLQRSDEQQKFKISLPSSNVFLYVAFFVHVDLFAQVLNILTYSMGMSTPTRKKDCDNV